MPQFTVLARKDACVDYTTVVWAEDAQSAVEVASRGGHSGWEERGVVEFDARRLVTLDAEGEEIESTARGDF